MAGALDGFKVIIFLPAYIVKCFYNIAKSIILQYNITNLFVLMCQFFVIKHNCTYFNILSTFDIFSFVCRKIKVIFVQYIQ